MIGRTIGTYRIESLLGKGGMGSVYRGLDLMLDRPVAIKALRADIAASADHVERFRQEARTLAKLLDPHIATLYALLREGDDLYMVMEFVEGETFEALLHRERRLPPRQALGLFRQALRGIDHAHRRGIVHRDVKPANFMVTPAGTVKVMDFGIARLLGSARMTQTRHAIGTAEYMAPEQVRAREVDARTDVYALGVLLYEMLTGRVPFDAPSAFETMQAHLQAPAPAPSRIVADLPESIESAILRALEKDPADRFPTVAALRDALPNIEDLPPDKDRQQPVATPAATPRPSGPAPPTVVAASAPEGEAADADKPDHETLPTAPPHEAVEPADEAGQTLIEPASDAPAPSSSAGPPTVAAPLVASDVTPDAARSTPATVVATAPAPETTIAPAPDRPPLRRTPPPIPRVALAVAGLALLVAVGVWTLRPAATVAERAASPTSETETNPAPPMRADASTDETSLPLALPSGSPPGTAPPSGAAQQPAPPQPSAQNPVAPRPTTPDPTPARTDPPAPSRQAPAASQPAPSPEPPQTGTARILVRPFGDVYLDGRRLARETNAPVTAELAPGTYTVRATHPVFGELTESVRIRAGQTTNVQLQFATPVEVTVTSDPPNAEILLDGRRTGRYTPAVITVPPGTHTIGAERDGYAAVSQSITIRAGQASTRVRLTLTDSR